MNFSINQFSSLEKIRCKADIPKKSITKKLLLKGERFSYQIAVCSDAMIDLCVSIKSPLKDYINLYKVCDVIMDYPCNREIQDDDYITKEPGSMPDMLKPLDVDDSSEWARSENPVVYWIEVNVPEDFIGKADIVFNIEAFVGKEKKHVLSTKSEMQLEIIDAALPAQEFMFTQWFHVDCIALAHGVEIYSEEHWELIDKYMKMAAKLGINMILTPVITPPLDTEYGRYRPCTQLIRIDKEGNQYKFDFSLLKRWIDLCRKNGIKYYEISHLFSQWGLKYSPNIYIYENGKGSYMFGWNVDANDLSYKAFLEQMIPALLSFLKSESIDKNCYFHISDEPNEEHIEQYRYAKEVLSPLLEGYKTFDALSSIDFYKNGLVTIPVPATDHIEPFLNEDIDERWTYYCCGQGVNVGNRFFAMPSYRNRILGLQLYKHNIKGFLHWGYNFYYKRLAREVINPFLTTSAGNGYPSGDAFSVYPYKDGVAPSLRAVVFKEALEDIALCRALEEYIGRDKVIEMIDREAGMDVTFSQYPRNNDYILNLTDKMKNIIKEKSAASKR